MIYLDFSRFELLDERLKSTLWHMECVIFAVVFRVITQCFFLLARAEVLVSSNNVLSDFWRGDVTLWNYGLFATNRLG